MAQSIVANFIRDFGRIDRLRYVEMILTCDGSGDFDMAVPDNVQMAIQGMTIQAIETWCEGLCTANSDLSFHYDKISEFPWAIAHDNLLTNPTGVDWYNSGAREINILFQAPVINHHLWIEILNNIVADAVLGLGLICVPTGAKLGY